MSYLAQDLGTDIIRIVPLIKNCVLMVVNEIDPLGSSLITGKRFPLDSLEHCFFKHLLPLPLTGALS